MDGLATAVLLTLQAAGAGAAQAPAEAPPAAVPQTADGPAAGGNQSSDIVVQGERPKQVCEIQTATGSIFPKRVCRTPEQVATDTENARIIQDRISRDRVTRQLIQEQRRNGS